MLLEAIFINKQNNNYYVAVDFDGTIVKDCFPDVGTRNEKVIRKIIERKEFLESQGYNVTFVLWTCRENLPERNYLTEAINFCKNHIPEIPFKYFNECPETSFGYPELVRKISCDEYWDDKAVEVI